MEQKVKEGKAVSALGEGGGGSELARREEVKGKGNQDRVSTKIRQHNPPQMDTSFSEGERLERSEE